MVLAAGRGTRLGELGLRRPKALIDLDGRPLLEHHLRHLGSQGVSHVVVNASHLAGQLEDFVRGFEGPPDVSVVFEPEPLGTAGGVINALSELDGGPLLVLYGDVLVGEDLRPMARVHAENRPVATLAVYRSEQAQAKGVVELEGNEVTAFREKDPEVTSGWVNAGIYIVEPVWLRGFTEPMPLDFGFDVFPATLAAGQDLRAHRLSRPVLDIGTPSDLARARGLPDG
jgi:NDP-sugar pyrophosphorylase family protein